MVDTNVSSTAEYQELEQKHNRHLNMMQENVSFRLDSTDSAFLQDRNLRRQALVEFNKMMDRTNIKTETLDFFYREKLVRRLVISLEDQIEKNREITIEILSKAIEKVGLKDESQILLPAIANRMSKIPYAEQCKWEI